MEKAFFHVGQNRDIICSDLYLSVDTARKVSKARAKENVNNGKLQSLLFLFGKGGSAFGCYRLRDRLFPAVRSAVSGPEFGRRRLQPQKEQVELWGEASKMANVMFSCPCCLRFKFSPEEIEQRYRSQEIDKMIEKEKHSFRRQVKLLLLGAGESGKSTFLKQMRIIHGVKFEPELVKEYQQVIYQNIVKGMKVLVDARNKLGIPWELPANSENGNYILRYENTMTLDTRLFIHYSPTLQNLWKDSGIRRAFERRREFQLSDSVQYFLENIERISRVVSSFDMYRLSLPRSLLTLT